VTNAVKVGRAKLLLMAVDTECSETLDGMLLNLIAQAREREEPVPTCYCLNRRGLGKALGMNTRQAAVAVYDPSGVYDAYKEILAFVHHWHIEKAAAT
jgi:ribosomal protein L7Ae-like RNA K-turn-binding protein